MYISFILMVFRTPSLHTSILNIFFHIAKNLIRNLSSIWPHEHGNFYAFRTLTGYRPTYFLAVRRLVYRYSVLLFVTVIAVMKSTVMKYR